MDSFVQFEKLYFYRYRPGFPYRRLSTI